MNFLKKVLSTALILICASQANGMGGRFATRFASIRPRAHAYMKSQLVPRTILTNSVKGIAAGSGVFAGCAALGIHTGKKYGGSSAGYWLMKNSNKLSLAAAGAAGGPFGFAACGLGLEALKYSDQWKKKAVTKS